LRTHFNSMKGGTPEQFENTPSTGEPMVAAVLPPKPENGNGHEEETEPESRAHDGAERRYATNPHQDALRRRIESQDLPVRERLTELVSAIIASADRKGTVLLQGETGSGKSIYSPVAVRQALRELNLPDRTMMMQPRRDAARGVARAVAAILREELGKEVGFSTSEAKEIEHDTKTGIVTPGIFLRYLKEGGLTKKDVGCLIVDELHEGSIEYHLALGLIKLMQEKGECPMLLLTSATLDKKRILDYFGLEEQDYLRIEGRTYPVEKYFLSTPKQEEEERRLKKDDYLEQTASRVNDLLNEGGDEDILVFLPGVKEITEVMGRIKVTGDVEVLPLHGMLGPDERDNALSGGKARGIRRRVIVATNIAETSVTIPGIRVVVDSCRQRSVRFNPQTGINETGTEFVSKDQAEQRAGRAGRMSEGVCYRIITEEKFKEFSEHPESEIRRKNLSSVVLQTKAMGILPEHFPFIEPPEQGAIDGAIKELQMLGALDAENNLTKLGYEMNDLPFEPRLSRMILYAKQERCLPQALVIAAFMREGNVLLGPTRRDINDAEGYSIEDKKKAARRKIQEIHKEFNRGGSDFLQNLTIFAEAIDHGVFEASRNDDSREARRRALEFEEWCRKKYVRGNALRHIAYKLQDYVKYLNRGKENEDRIFLDRSTLADELMQTNDETVGAAILAAFPDKLLYSESFGGMRRGLPEYYPIAGTRQTINISPGSAAFDLAPKLCIAAEIKDGPGTFKGVAIKRNYAQDVQPISLAQMRKVLPHLLREEPQNARYDGEKDEVITRVDVSVVRGDEKVFIGREEAVAAGELAVSVFAKALASGSLDLPCVRHNGLIFDNLQKNFARSGGKLSLPNMEKWYRERLGNVHTVRDAAALGDTLNLNQDEVFSPETREELDTLYPVEKAIGGTLCRISYTYDTYSPEDRRFTALISFPAGRPQAIFSLEDGDIPRIGKSGDNLRVSFEAYGEYGSRYVENDLEALKNKIDADNVRNSWSRWRGKPPPKPLDIVPLGKVPTLDELEAHPIAYAETRNKQPILAYPAIQTDHIWSGKEYQTIFYLDYFPDKSEADRVMDKSAKAKIEMDGQESKRIEIDRLARDAEGSIAKTKTRMAHIGMMFLQKGFSKSQWTDVENKTREAEASIAGRDKYGRTVERNPEQALILIQEIQNIFERVEMLNSKRPQLEAETKRLRSTLYPVVEKALLSGESARFGIDYEQNDELYRAWKKAQELMEEANGDLVIAEELLLKLQAFFAKPVFEKWMTPAALRYAEVSGPRERNITARIVVRAGRVFDNNSRGGERTYINMGDSIKATVQSQRGNAVLFMEGNYGEPTGDAFILPEGEYAIPTGAQALFKVVTDSRGVVTEVISELKPTKAPPKNVSAMSSGAYTTSKSETASTSGLGSLGDAFKKVDNKTSETPSVESLLKLLRQGQSEAMKNTFAEEHPKEGPLTPAIREALFEEMELLNLYLGRVKSVGGRVKEPKTSRDKAINTMLDRAGELQREVNALSTEIVGAGETERESSFRGKISSLAGSIKAILKRNASQVFTASYALNWFDTYKTLRSSLPEVLRSNELATEIIESQLVTREQFLQKAEAKLETRISEIEQGKNISIVEIIDEVADDVTK